VEKFSIIPSFGGIIENGKKERRRVEEPERRLNE
jgi:hypothetical protein